MPIHLSCFGRLVGRLSHPNISIGKMYLLTFNMNITFTASSRALTPLLEKHEQVQPDDPPALSPQVHMCSAGKNDTRSQQTLLNPTGSRPLPLPLEQSRCLHVPRQPLSVLWIQIIRQWNCPSGQNLLPRGIYCISGRTSPDLFHMQWNHK